MINAMGLGRAQRNRKNSAPVSSVCVFWALILSTEKEEFFGTSLC